MSAIKSASPKSSRRPDQRGVAAVEFALVAMIFFTIVFGIIEVTRALYICITLQEVTRQAAARATNTDFTDGTALQRVRERAIFRDSPGGLLFAQPISDQHINIDYLRLHRCCGTMSIERIPEASLPDSPEANHANCTRNPYGESCIRLVRVRVCQEGSGATCTPVPYQTLTSFLVLAFGLPRSETITQAETLGLASASPP